MDKAKVKREIQGWVFTILAVLAFRTLLYEAVYIPSGSMIPTLQIGDYVVVEKWAFGARLPFTESAQAMWSSPRRGDIVVLLALLLEQNPAARIALAAPTGKAAARLQESVRNAKATLACDPKISARLPEEASTLHRLLGYRPDSAYFRHDAQNPLPCDVIVVDEASMVDLALMAKLVAAENAWQVVDDALQIFGGNGYIRGEYMIERLWRDLRVARVYDGSSEVQQIVIAQRLRKGDVETRYAEGEG